MILKLWSTAPPIAANMASTAEFSETVKRWMQKSDSMEKSGFGIVILVAIVLVWIWLFLWDRSRRLAKKVGIDREGLFTQLCDLHNLSKTDRQLLQTLAETQRIGQPALAFVNPSLLLSFAESDPGASAEVRNLADRLFGHALIEEIVTQSGDRH
jgi:hypothetical protein